MWNIEEFWKQKLAGAENAGISKIAGWSSNTLEMPGFVEPTLSLVEGDPSDAQLFIIAAPGAVGKSSYARALAAATKSVIVDLARTAPLGGGFFKGELANAFGLDALSNAGKGKIALVVDALDEAQMRVGPQSYEAGLLDLAGIAGSASALPAVLLGRALAAENAFLLLTANGFKVALFKVEFFGDDQAAQYLINKLPIVAARSEKVAAAFRTHGDVFRELAESARVKLKALAGCDQTNFAGYAPVLDAICEFALEGDGLNPKAKMAKLTSASQIDLIDDITLSILEREQEKLRGQFQEQHADASASTLSKLYTVEDQLEQVSFNLFGGTAPPYPELPKEAYYTTYQEMVETFAPQHPFVSASGAASNPVFAAFVVAWALRKSGHADLVRKAVLAKPNLMSGIFFELYDRQLQSEPGAKMPLADVGILYQALNSQITPGQRVQLEVLDQDASTIEVSFEILAKVDSKGDPLDGKTWGPYPSENDSMLELHSPFSNVYVDAPIMMQLGDGIVQQIGAPTELAVQALMISAKQVLVHPNAADAAKEFQTATIFAEEADLTGVQTVTVRDGATLSVSWPNATIFPWNSHVVDIPAAADEGVDFMRRRVRRILTAFRSHSKGALVRLAAKIDSNRMTKDERGVALVDKLIKDGILVPFDAGKFYRLDQDIMGKVMGVGYHDLAQSRFTPQLDSYLTDVLAGMPKAR
ncbi:hypothetical protein [Bradyrhizobium genosp. P]|uniref:hypothetical protein n=1 Tax=Bradyrhizobium genosp. P TaxID=83641 RepID=UPI003CEA9CC3